VIRRASHLVSRFAGSVRPGGPRAADVAWVESRLSPAELALWQRMPAADRRESVAVARRFVRNHGTEPLDALVAAALLHDVGKTEANLGTVGRSLATMAGVLAGHDVAPAWQARGGISRRFALYLRHEEVGAGMLEIAGARREAVAWARAHHHAEQWDDLPFPRSAANALARADGERVPSD